MLEAVPFFYSRIVCEDYILNKIKMEAKDTCAKDTLNKKCSYQIYKQILK